MLTRRQKEKNNFAIPAIAIKTRTRTACAVSLPRGTRPAPNPPSRGLARPTPGEPSKEGRARGKKSRRPQGCALWHDGEEGELRYGKGPR